MTDNSLNIRDIAKAAKVSVATVSRALNLPSGLEPSEKQRRILALCKELHYEPNEHFRRLYSQRANTVAILFKELAKDVPGNGGFELYADLNLSSCIRGAQEYLAENGMDLLLLEATSKFIAEKRYLKMIRGKLLDGVLLWGMTEAETYNKEILAEGIPVVMVQNEVASLPCSKVVSDDYAGICELLERAIDAGHSKFAIIRFSQDNSVGRQRMAGIYDTLKRHRMKPVFETDTEDASCFSGEEAARLLMASNVKPTCIVAACAPPAFGCAAELKRLGVAVPRDISILSAGGINLPGMSENFPSFISNSKQIGRLGAEQLLKEIKGDTSLQRILVPTIKIQGAAIAACNARKNKPALRDGGTHG